MVNEQQYLADLDGLLREMGGMEKHGNSSGRRKIQKFWQSQDSHTMSLKESLIGKI
jgi:hypothetical protein